MSEEKREATFTMERLFAGFLGFVSKLIIEKHGEEGRQLIYDAMKKTGEYMAESYLNANKDAKKGLDGIIEYYGLETLPETMKLLERTESKYKLKISDCAYLKVWRDIDILPVVPDICDMIAAFDDVVTGIFDPKIRLATPKAMGKGDDCCIYYYEKSE